MASFPRLKTDAVMQYPATRSVRFATGVVRFLDGTEQRYRGAASALRGWVIRLELLDESEMAAVEEFFRENQGAFATFSFTDPWDGTEHPNCSLDSDELAPAWDGEMRGRVALRVRENRA